MADALVEDEVGAIAGAVRTAFDAGPPVVHRSSQVERYEARLAGMDPLDQLDGPAASVLCADGSVRGERARFLTVVPDPEARFPRARSGELGLEEGWALARRVREVVTADDDRGDRRALIAIVDVPGQPYGYREELLGLHLALAAAVDAYATARLAGHPVVALVVGQAISGAFLAHGMQANRILALDDSGVAVQVMSKRSTARVTR